MKNEMIFVSNEADIDDKAVRRSLWRLTKEFFAEELEDYVQIRVRQTEAYRKADRADKARKTRKKHQKAIESKK